MCRGNEARGCPRGVMGCSMISIPILYVSAAYVTRSKKSSFIAYIQRFLIQ